MRVKRQADRLAAELFRLHRDRPRRYKALARQHALRDLEEALHVPAARLEEPPELPVPPPASESSSTEDEASGAASPARRKRSVGFALPA